MAHFRHDGGVKLSDTVVGTEIGLEDLGADVLRVEGGEERFSGCESGVVVDCKGAVEGGEGGAGGAADAAGGAGDEGEVGGEVCG